MKENVMLLELLEKAVSIGATRVEIERKDGREWIFAFHGQIGAGIGSADGKDAKLLFQELDALKKTKRADLNGMPYRLVFSQYESFGEWVDVIEMKPAPAGPAKGRRRTGST
jgi:hypothetical protein